MEYSFEVSDLAMDNLSSAIIEDEERMIENGRNLTLDDFANSTTDIGNLAVLCGLTITNQSLKIVQVNSYFYKIYIQNVLHENSQKYLTISNQGLNG